MPGQAADRNLLFGILALQMDFITRDGLIAGMNAWAVEKFRPLGEILVEQEALEPRFRALLEPMVEAHIERHGGDPARSLATVVSMVSTASSIRERIDDPEILASIASISTRADEEDPFATRVGGGFGPGPAGLRYHKVRNHRKGGLGIVYVAHDQELRREVALKEIQERYADDPIKRTRFLIEAEVTGNLEHPGIVPVYGLGSYEDGRPFYAMRFIKGDSLRAAIADFHADESFQDDPGARTLALQKLLRRFLDVCNAIAYAHSRGVLHRDLKPDNVMIGKFGETLVVDWGLAKTTGKSGDEISEALPEATISPASTSGSHETQPGSVIGTPPYMSPEQAAGRLDLLGPPSDVYSLGATLYTLLTGRAPFIDPDMTELLRKVQRGEFPRPRETMPWIDPALEAVCLKAMSLKPESRYPSSRALADDVDRWLAGSPVLCWKEPLVRKMRRWVGRNRTLVTSSVSLLATTAVALGIGIILINNEKTKVTEEKTKVTEEKTKVTEESRLRGLATQAAELAEKRAIAESNKAKEEAAKTLNVINLLVGTFRSADPIGIEGFGLRGGSDVGKTLTSREILDRSTEKLKAELADQPLIRATLMDAIGDVYRGMAELDRAEPLLTEAWKIRKDLLSEDDPDLATSLLHLAWLSQDRIQFDEAEKLFLDAWERRKHRFGELSQQALEVQAHLGYLWLINMEDDKAEVALTEVIDKFEQMDGDHSREIAIARLGLTGALLELQRLPEALKQIALAKVNLAKFADGEQVLTAVNNFQVAFGLTQIGQYRRAEVLFRDSLAKMRVVMGPDHPYLAFFYHEIGQIQLQAGDDVQAEASFKDCMDMLRRRVGLNHPRAKLAVLSLATLLVRKGRPAEARALYEERLAACRKAYAADHPRIADALVSLADFAQRQGDLVVARRSAEEALVIYRAKPNASRFTYLQGLFQLSNVLLAQNHPVEAEPLLREALPLARKFYRTKQDVAVVLNLLGLSLMNQARYDDEAESLLTEAAEGLRSSSIAYALNKYSSLSRLARLEYLRGKFDRSEIHSREALTVARQAIRDKPALLSAALRDLGGVLAARGDLAGAMAAVEEAVKVDEQAGPNQLNLWWISRSQLALLRAVASDPARRRADLNLLLQDARGLDQPANLSVQVWTMARFANPVIEPAELEKMARRLLAVQPSIDNFKIIGSVALLRAGRVEEAVRGLEGFVRQRPLEMVHVNLYLAIGYRHLGRFDDAQAARSRAMVWIDRPEKFTRNWDVQLEVKQLRKEVDDLWANPTGELPRDVFAP